MIVHLSKLRNHVSSLLLAELQTALGFRQHSTDALFLFLCLIQFPCWLLQSVAFSEIPYFSWSWQFWVVLARGCVECPSFENSCILMVTLGSWLGKERHRAAGPLCKGFSTSVWLITGDIYLDHLVKWYLPGFSTMKLPLFFSFFLFLKIFIYLFSESGKGEGREKERERNIDALPLTHASTGDWTCAPGMYPDRDLNWQLLALWNDARPSHTCQDGTAFDISSLCSVGVLHSTYYCCWLLICLFCVSPARV